MLPSQGNKALMCLPKLYFDYKLLRLDSVKDKGSAFKTKPVVLVSTLIAKPFYCRVTLKKSFEFKTSKIIDLFYLHYLFLYNFNSFAPP
jgi:hypothetical protein